MRAVWKKHFFRAWKVVFLQSHACMSFKRLVHKKQFFGAWKIVFAQSRASLSFMRAVWKNNFSELEKLIFCKASVFFKLLMKTYENNVSGPQAYPHMDFGWNGSSPNMRAKNNFSEPEKLNFCKASVFFKLLMKTYENNVSGPQAYPHMVFGWNGSSPNTRAKNNFSEPEKLFFCKAQFHPVRQYKGPRQKKMNR